MYARIKPTMLSRIQLRTLAEIKPRMLAGTEPRPPAKSKLKMLATTKTKTLAKGKARRVSILSQRFKKMLIFTPTQAASSPARLSAAPQPLRRGGDGFFFTNLTKLAGKNRDAFWHGWDPKRSSPLLAPELRAASGCQHPTACVVQACL